MNSMQKEGNLSDSDENLLLISINEEGVIQTSSPSYSPVPMDDGPSTSTSGNNINDKIKFLDSKKTLAIWRYINDYDRDVLVKEYCDTIYKLGRLPEIPDVDKFKTLPQPSYTLPSSVVINCLHNFTSYFQSKYFCQNIKKAVDHNVAVFNPKLSFMMPQYFKMPLAAIKEISILKNTFALGMQLNSLEGSAFIIELLLLRIMSQISNYVESKVQNHEEQLNNTQYFFLSCYLTARMNFLKTYNVKKIDWSKKESKVTEPLPKWRREQAEPPKNIPNRYSVELAKRIAEGKQSINGLKVLQDFENLSNPEKVSNSKNKDNQKTNEKPNLRSMPQAHPLRRPEKPHTMSKKGQSRYNRNYNPKLIQKRNINSSESSQEAESEKLKSDSDVLGKGLDVSSNTISKSRARRNRKFINLNNTFTFYNKVKSEVQRNYCDDIFLSTAYRIPNSLQQEIQKYRKK